MAYTLLPSDPTPPDAPSPPPAAGGYALLPDDTSPIAQAAGVTGRGLLQGAASLFSMPFNAGVKVGNMVNKYVIDPITGFPTAPYPDFSQQLDSALTALGVPEPKTKAQRVAEAAYAGLSGAAAISKTAGAIADSAGPVTQDVLQMMAQNPGQQMTSGALGGAASQGTAELGGGPISQTVAGMAASAIPGSYSRVAAPPILTPEQQALRQWATDNGYNLTPFQQTGKRWQGNLEAAMRQMPSTSGTMQEIDALNAANTNRLTSGALDAAGGPIDQGSAGAAAMGGMTAGIEGAANATGSAYKALLGNVPIDLTTAKPSLTALQAKYAALPEDIQGGPGMVSLNTLLGTPKTSGYLAQNPTVPGEVAQDLRSAYGSASNSAFNSGSNDVGALYKGMKGAIDSAIEQSLPQNAQGNFAALNEKYGMDMAISNLTPKNQETFLNQLYRGSPDQFYTFLGVADPRAFSQTSRGFISKLLENATSNETGNVSATKLGGAIDKLDPGASGRADVMQFLGGPQSDVLRQVGQVGQNVLPDGAPNSGTAQRMMFQSLMEGGGVGSGGALGSIGGMGGTLAGAAVGRFLIPSLIQKAYLSNAMRGTLMAPPTQGSWQLPENYSGALGTLGELAGQR